MVACLFCFFLFPVYVLFDISCYCLFGPVVYVVGEGPGFVKRGVVVGCYTWIFHKGYVEYLEYVAGKRDKRLTDKGIRSLGGR